MAPGQKMYPRATVKKIVKAHTKCNVSKNVDVMVSVSLLGLGDRPHRHKHFNLIPLL